MMDRVPEPVLMTDINQCLEFSNSNRAYIRDLFLTSLLERYTLTGTILNLGSGPCDYDIDLCGRVDNINLISVDASPAMIEIARENTKGHPINLVCEYFNNIDYQSDTTISSLTLHHQHNALDFWKAVKKNTKPSGNVFVMDMLRPSSYDEINKIVNVLAEKDSEIFKTDFKNSLAASFTVEEIKQQLIDAELDLKIETVGSLGIIALIHGQL